MQTRVRIFYKLKKKKINIRDIIVLEKENKMKEFNLKRVEDETSFNVSQAAIKRKVCRIIIIEKE